MYLYICVKQNHFAVHLKHCESTILQQKNKFKKKSPVLGTLNL